MHDNEWGGHGQHTERICSGWCAYALRGRSLRSALRSARNVVTGTASWDRCMVHCDRLLL